MKLIEILKPDFIFEDERGTLCQITHKKYAQTNVVFTKAGTVRGNFHYHETTDEVFYIIDGEIEITLRLNDKSETHLFKSGDMFRIPENVRHSFNYLKDTHLIGFYTKRVEKEDGTKDIISDNQPCSGENLK